MSIERQVAWLGETIGLHVLAEQAVVEVTGDDAHEWLQGQVTNDLSALKMGASVYGFVLTPKGRVLVDAWVTDVGEGYHLVVPASQVAPLIERLERYLIMEDVELAHREALRVVTLQGPRAQEIESGWPADRLGAGGRDLWVEAEELEALVARLTDQCAALEGGVVGEAAWSRAHVLAGVPRFGVDFGARTYPQETGLTHRAVSFSKGCYLGQETVMMLQSRGKAPKTLWRWQIERSEPTESGTPIRSGDRVAGEITSAVAHGGETIALGFLKRGQSASDPEGFAVEGAPARPLGPVEDGDRVGAGST